MSEPRCTQVSVQYSQGGKVAIKEYGKISSDWHISFSRNYEVPEGWTDDEIMEFQIAKREEFREVIDPIDQDEFDKRYKQRDWND